MADGQLRCGSCQISMPVYDAHTHCVLCRSCTQEVPCELCRDWTVSRWGQWRKTVVDVLASLKKADAAIAAKAGKSEASPAMVNRASVKEAKAQGPTPFVATKAVMLQVIKSLLAPINDRLDRIDLKTAAKMGNLTLPGAQLVPESKVTQKEPHVRSKTELDIPLKKVLLLSVITNNGTFEVPYTITSDGQIEIDIKSTHL